MTKSLITSNMEIVQVRHDLSDKLHFVMQITGKMEDESELNMMIKWLKSEFNIMRKD